jgi:type I restriction enzyme S subunit
MNWALKLQFGGEGLNVPELRFPEFVGEWEEKKLNEISVVNPKSDDLPDKFLYIDLGSVSNGMLGKKKHITKEKAPSRAQRVLKNNDIIYQTVRPYQKNNLFFLNKDSEQYVASTGYAQIRTKEYPKFIYHFIHSDKFVNKVLARCTGTSYPAINSKDLGQIKIDVPSHIEQKKIEAFISKIDGKIEKLKKKEKLWNNYKKGILNQLFSQEIRFKDDKGNSYPDWTHEPMGQVANIFKGFTPSTSRSEYWDGGLFWLSIADMNQGKYLKKSSKTISEKGCENKRIIPKNSLVMSFKLTLGRLGILKTDMYSNEAICNFEWKQDIITEYMYYYLSSIDIRTFGSQAAKGITLNNDSLNSIIVKIPFKQEQIKIAQFLSAIDQKIGNISKEININSDFKKGLLQQMIP